MTAHEHLAREAKSRRLISFLDTYGEGFATSDTLKALSPEQRDAVCVLAGEKRMASSTTWQVVIQTICERENRKAVA